jgi:hypothetical protein
MGQFQWRLTGLKEREKARAVAKASQKTRVMEKESQKESKRARMTQRENPRMVIRKEKAMLVIDPKGKEKEKGTSVTYVVAQGILLVNAGSPRYAM